MLEHVFTRNYPAAEGALLSIIKRQYAVNTQVAKNKCVNPNLKCYQQNILRSQFINDFLMTYI